MLQHILWFGLEKSWVKSENESIIESNHLHFFFFWRDLRKKIRALAKVCDLHYFFHDKKNAINDWRHTNVCMKLDLPISGSYDCAFLFLGLRKFQSPWSVVSSLRGEIRPFAMTQRGQFIIVIGMSQGSLNGLIHIL